MKLLFIPESNDQVAGPQTFLRNLSKFLKDNSFSFTYNLDEAEAIFVSPTYTMEAVKKIKDRVGIVIQRLDGAYYRENAEMLNSEMKDIYKNYSDFVIFQSEYSRKQIFELLGEIDSSKYALIVNGVDKEIFYPAEKNELDKKIKFITTGNFRNPEMIEPVVLALDLLKDKYDFELNIAGPVVNPDLEKFFNRDYINMLGSLDMNEVANALRENNIFIYSHLNPPCPNSVVEAISVGLPVVGFNSGSMSELLFFSKDLLAEVSDSIIQDSKDFDFRKLAEKIELSINEFNKFRELSKENSKLYSFEECGKEYIKVFKNLL